MRRLHGESHGTKLRTGPEARDQRDTFEGADWAIPSRPVLERLDMFGTVEMNLL